MDTSVGTKTIVWGSIGAELISVVYDLRWMVILSIVLILADMWWGHSETMKRFYEAKKIGNATLQEQFRWHKSRAVRRTCNKLVDYTSYLILGALFGMAITEPMGICDHIWTAALGLLIGGGCELASIIGHVAYVKFGIELKMVDAWKFLVRFVGRMIRVKSNEIGEAVEDLGRDGHHHHHHSHEMPDVYDEETNMED